MNTKVTWLILLTGLYSCGQTTSVNQKPVKPGAGVSSNSKKIESGDAEAADLYDQRSRKKGLVPAVAGNVTTPDLTASVPTQPPLNLVSNPEQMGPMAVKSYTDGLSDSSYSSSIIFYPDDDATAKLQVYLAGNQIYATYIDGEKLKEDRARGGIADFQLRK